MENWILWHVSTFMQGPIIVEHGFLEEFVYHALRFLNTVTLSGVKSINLP